MTATTPIRRPQNGAFASLEELWQTVKIADGALHNGNKVYMLGVAPFPLAIVQFSLVSESVDVVESETDYLREQLYRYSPTGNAAGADKYTRASDGEGWTSRTDWNFDAEDFTPFNGAENEYAKGDVIALRHFPTGTPSLPVGVTAMFRYEPL